MTCNLKRYLLWLLIAVLPIQGFAAVVLRSCGSGPMVVASVAPAASMHDHAAHAMDAASEQPAHMAGHDAGAGHGSDASKKSGSGHHVKHGSCSACASCCVGAAAPPALYTFLTPFNMPEVRRMSGVTPVIGFIPDSLERPPRHAFI